MYSNVSSDGDSSPENCAKYDQNDGNVAKHEHTEENSENETSENDEGNKIVVLKALAVTRCKLSCN